MFAAAGHSVFPLYSASLFLYSPILPSFLPLVNDSYSICQDTMLSQTPDWAYVCYFLTYVLCPASSFYRRNLELRKVKSLLQSQNKCAS